MMRSIAVAAAMLLALSSWVWVDDAEARAGRGGSSGSRGSRSYSAPAPSSPSMAPSRPSAPPSPAVPPPPPQRPGWGGMGGMLGGLLVGGLLGSLLFGGLGGHGLVGGIGLLEILVIGGLAVFAISWMRRRQVQPAGGPSYAGGYGASSYGSGGWTPSQSPTEPVEQSATAVVEPPAAPSDVERGLGHIRQMDAAFDPARFAEWASDAFFEVQAAWTTRDLSRAASLLTPEMRAALQAQCDRLRADRQVNRLENIAVRRVEVSEAWQERGQDFVTVHFLATALDYTTDETGANVLEGSRTEPVKFEEYWTFVRPVGPNAWRLSAIQQPS